MLHFDSIVFGPIRSRRLGSSLGINLMPQTGKLCNFDCIYCECGWNRDGQVRSAVPEYGEVVSALEERLTLCRKDSVQIDSITFSGNGEPMLHPRFADIVDATISLRDKYYPQAKLSVLSNATVLDKEGVLEALKKVDNPILKLDAPTDEAVAMINKPVGHYSVDKVVEGLKRFDGNFILQTMFLHGAGFDYSKNPELLAAWMNIVRELHPRKVMVYTLDRPAPQKGLEKMTFEEMEKLLQPLKNENFNIQINV